MKRGILYIVLCILLAFNLASCKENDGAGNAAAPQPVIDAPTIIKSIEITNSDVSYAEGTGKFVMLTLGDDGSATYQINFRYFAHRTHVESDPLVEGNDPNNVCFVYDTALNCATVSDTGLVTFTKSGVLTVKLYPKTSVDCMDEIIIAARRG